MKAVIVSIKMVLFSTVALGFMYTGAVTLLSGVLFKNKAEGSLLLRNGQVIGSELLAQKFTSPQYFWPRPSAFDFSAVPSGATNNGPISQSLKSDIDKRSNEYQKAHASKTPVPPELLFSSASGLDPHISPEAAEYQMPRVSEARHLTGEQKNTLMHIVRNSIEKPQLYFIGMPRINVLRLNVKIDETFGAGNTGN